MTPKIRIQNALLAHFLGKNLAIFGLSQNDTRSKFMHRSNIINALPHEMRRVEVQSQCLVGNAFEDLTPAPRANGNVEAGIEATQQYLAPRLTVS